MPNGTQFSFEREHIDKKEYETILSDHVAYSWVDSTIRHKQLDVDEPGCKLCLADLIDFSFAPSDQTSNFALRHMSNSLLSEHNNIPFEICCMTPFVHSVDNRTSPQCKQLDDSRPPVDWLTIEFLHAYLICLIHSSIVVWLTCQLHATIFFDHSRKQLRS